MQQPRRAGQLAIVFLGTLFLPIPVAAQLPAEATELLNLATKHEQEQNYVLATEALAELLKRDPSNERLYARWQDARRQDRIAKRYRAPDVQRRLVETSLDKSVRLFSEVVGTIGDHHVIPLDAQRLWQAGVRQIDLALANQSFVKAVFGVAPNGETLARYRATLAERQRDVVVADRAALEKKVPAFALAIQQDVGANATAVMLEFIHAACETFDPYGAYLDPQRLMLERTAARPDVASVGLELRPLRDQLIVASVASDGPAAQAGILVNELLVSFDGIAASLLTPEEATLRLLGEDGSSLVLQVQGILDAQPRTLRLARRRLRAHTVLDARILDEMAGVGYVRVSSFAATTPEELETALASLAMSGMRALVLDLRDNPGGNLEAAVQVGDRFLSSGVVTSTQGRSPGVERIYEARANNDLDVPLVVLVNGGTASAAEVLAGALQEHRRAMLVGAKTHGKNSVQYVFALRSDRGGVRLTAAHYYLPFERPLPEAGLTPDVPASDLPASLDAGMPVSMMQLQQWQLDVALRTARELLERK